MATIDYKRVVRVLSPLLNYTGSYQQRSKEAWSCILGEVFFEFWSFWSGRVVGFHLLELVSWSNRISRDTGT
jgi:hypothetical protein